ncbi:unnamed protein product [Leuciscus chuanchicus]
MSREQDEPKVMDEEMLQQAIVEQGLQGQSGQKTLAEPEGVYQLRLDFRNLSFNNIEVIEGLDSLVKLQDLSLFNNRISVIENLDALQNLNILSIGNNSIAQLDNVLYLKQFKNLRTLNLAGNPICDEEDFKTFVTAKLPDLVYLDYRRQE